MNKTHRRAIVADAHNDLLCAVVTRPVERWGAYFREQWLPQLRTGGVDIQVLPVFIDALFRPENSLRQTLRMIEAAYRIAEHNSDAVAVCVDGTQIDSALANGQIALVLALEGTPGIADDVELLQTMHRLGIRMASMTHFGRSAFADGSAENHTRSRLTTPGVAAVAELERLGVLLDISHLGANGVDHVLEIATRPVIASHSSARAVYDHHRNLSDEHIRGVSSSGGVVCVNFHGPFIHQSERTIDRLVDHFEHIASVAGVEHVGIGSDFVQEAAHDSIPRGCERPVLDVDTFIPGLEGPSGLPLVTQALQQRGWPEGDIAAVLGGNLRAFLVNHLTDSPSSLRPRPFDATRSTTR